MCCSCCAEMMLVVPLPQRAAPGQPTLQQLSGMYGLKQQRRDTEVFGIVGNPVSHRWPLQGCSHGLLACLPACRPYCAGSTWLRPAQRALPAHNACRPASPNALTAALPCPHLVAAAAAPPSTTRRCSRRG